jgi:gas vesicle structural protein
MSVALAPEALRRADLQRQVTLLDLVDRILDKGAVIQGQVVLAVADVDLVKLDLKLLLASVEALRRNSE